MFCGLWYDDEFLRTAEGLADDPPGRDEVLPENSVAARSAEFLT